MLIIIVMKIVVMAVMAEMAVMGVYICIILYIDQNIFMKEYRNLFNLSFYLRGKIYFNIVCLIYLIYY